MITHIHILENFIPEAHLLPFNGNSAIFFDIETTGFTAGKNSIYLIGCCLYENQRWQVIQWMAENQPPDEQTAVLEAFLDCISHCKNLVSFNGATFDLPFIEKSCAHFKIPCDFSNINHYDIYKAVRPLKKLLGMKSLKLKAIEQFLGIFREDQYSGGALIPIYETYIKSQSQKLLSLLLLHNFEDIKDMLHILPILNYTKILDSKNCSLTLTLCQWQGDGLHLQLEAECLFPVQITKDLPITSALDSSIKIIFNNSSIELFIPSYHGELLYFYENYRDYYYLPDEGCAVHKSVAQYVDTAHRKKATPKNCYTRKSGIFLPQPEPLITPAFKYAYDDSWHWFEYTENVSKGTAFHEYICRLLQLCIA